MAPLSWDQLEEESNAVMKSHQRRGNGTRSTFANNGEFDGSAKQMPNANELGRAGGGSSPTGSGKPRALFVSKDGSPVLTWNEIEQINMDDLNTALGSFNPGQKLKKRGKRQNRKFHGFRKGNGGGFVNAKNTGAMINISDDKAYPGGTSNSSSPLQSRRILRPADASTRNGVTPQQPRKTRRRQQRQ